MAWLVQGRESTTLQGRRVQQGCIVLHGSEDLPLFSVWRSAQNDRLGSGDYKMKGNFDKDRRQNTNWNEYILSDPGVA